jgi:hypothetical protein
MPAAVLVLMVLGAIAVDLSLAFIAQRELADATAAAANDAAGAIDLSVFRGSGELRVDERQARRAAQEAYDARAAGYLREPTIDVEVTPCPRVAALTCVRVRMIAAVEYLFARTIPGAPPSVTVEAISMARLQPGP